MEKPYSKDQCDVDYGWVCNELSCNGICLPLTKENANTDDLFQDYFDTLSVAEKAEKDTTNKTISSVKMAAGTKVRYFSEHDFEGENHY